MCRNIKPLFNFEPAATDEEVRAAALQFVRKISGFTKPSKANQGVFDAAVDSVAASAQRLIAELITDAPTRDREEWIQKMREKSQARYGAMASSRK